jgi:hypothetical protein
MDNLVTVFIVAVSFAGGAFAVTSILAARRRRHAHQILGKGGPSSAAEWAFLYPGCCPHCNSREQVIVEWNVSWQGGFGVSGVGTASGSFTECADCLRVIGGETGEGRYEVYAETSRRNRKVASPFVADTMA